MKIKPGVDLRGLQPEMTIALAVAKATYYDKGGASWVRQFTLTSGLEGKHSAGSLHYVGLAVDIRTSFVPRREHSLLVEKLRENLGARPVESPPIPGQYDVVLHSTHIHIEFDPNEGDVRRASAKGRTTRAKPEELVQYV